MADFPHDRLTPLQGELLEGFFAREQRFFLTGGGALAAFYLGHRVTEDLGLFAPPGPALDDAQRAVVEAAVAVGAQAMPATVSPDFRRLRVSRGGERCVVDLVTDRAPAVDAAKNHFGAITVDTPREILANKVCALIGRSAIRDLVDLEALLATGLDLRAAFRDAAVKDAGADPATLAYVLEQLHLGEQALLPGGVSAKALDAFRVSLIARLRTEAWALAAHR
jgi:Nucleotidyl transferase AbiEii toxin, Type IV TA system